MRTKARLNTLCLLLFALILAQTAAAQTAPGGPGADAKWASAGKQGVGTSASLESKIWFTLQGGALTDVYYPNVAVNNVHMLQFVVVDPKTKKVETERDEPFQKKCVGNWQVSQAAAKSKKNSVKFPLTGEDGTVLFAFKGKAKKVEIAGDFSNWKPEKYEFAPVPDSDFKCFQMQTSSKARFEYKLIVDGKWILDPLNPKKIDNGVGGENSVVEMPGYRPTEWAKDFDSSLSAGISEMTVKSAKFGERKIKIYLPTEYFKRGIAPKLPVLYLQDGSEYIERAKAINIVENLTAAKKVEPFMIVFIDPQDRMKEYWASDDWADFMALEVVPAVETKYFNTIKKGRENRALLGASLGGITSIWTGLRHPSVFERIGAQSASFWVDDERVVKKLEGLDNSKNAFRFYIDDGVFEGTLDSRKVVDLLKKKGFTVTYIESDTGNNWTSWRDRLAEAFINLWD